MAGAAVLGRLRAQRVLWHVAEVADATRETPRARTLMFTAPGWEGHQPGQHVDVRLTAEDGYQAQRSYSIASAPAGERLAITVERLDDGEVSPYLVDEIQPGDAVELRGPIGGYFVWEPEDPAPVLLVAGGSGVVPLMSMLRHHAGLRSEVPVRLLYSSRTLGDVIYRDELVRLSHVPVEVIHTLTREQPAGWNGYSRRVDAELLAEVAWPLADRPAAFICGPSGFVETVAQALAELGYEAARLKTERFGPTGG